MSNKHRLHIAFKIQLYYVLSLCGLSAYVVQSNYANLSVGWTSVRNIQNSL